MHVTILGAGLAGLAAAYELSRSGVEVTLVEAEDAVGGMAQSFRVNGHWLDHGPHRFYSRDRELIAHLYEVLDGDVVVRQRVSRIFLRGRYFDYPLRVGNVLRNLPPTLLLRSIADYVIARISERLRPTPDANFERWVTKRFGRTLYKLFFGTYTEKAWGMSPTRISSDWASQRISQANLWETIKTTLFPERSGELRSLAAEFYYPREGGIGALTRAYEAKLKERGVRIELTARVDTIEHEGDRVRAVAFERDGERTRIEADYVINTIPLPTIAQQAEPPLPQQTNRAAAALSYIGIVFVYFEVDQPTVLPDHWVYLPGKELSTHRVCEFKNFSDSASPGDRTALCCEITCRAGDATWEMSFEEAARIAASDLYAAGLVEPGRARPLALKRLRFAYPVYDLEYRTHLKELRDATKAWRNFYSTGRQGLFRYNNMDHSIAMGRKAARTAQTGIDAGAEQVALEAEYFG